MFTIGQKVKTGNAAGGKSNTIGVIISGPSKVNGTSGCYAVRYDNGQEETWHESRLKAVK